MSEKISEAMNKINGKFPDIKCLIVYVISGGPKSTLVSYKVYSSLVENKYMPIASIALKNASRAVSSK